MSDIKIISSKDKNFPNILKNISPAVEQLYIRGQLPDLSHCFAIVGTRRFSPYGKQIVLDIGYQLAKAGLTIVSGLAEGIDTCAHQAALQAKQKTIAVLGTGLDDQTIFPPSNLKLSKDIIKSGGCLISEYPPETSGYKSNFPARNRIIAALSLGTLVVEAKEKSGSLITADWTKRYEKKLFAVPGPINSVNSKGCNKLIKQGAILVDSANDILQELRMQTINFNNNLPLADNPTQKIILTILKGQQCHVEQIIKLTGLPAGLVCSTLSLLEIDNKIKNLGGNIYSL